MKLKGGKAHFAESVVPTLDAKDFGQFEKIFEVIEQLISQYAVDDKKNIAETENTESLDIFA